MNIKRTVAPVECPLDLEEAKDYLNVYHSDDDKLIWLLIEAATSQAEDYTQRAFYTQTFVQTGRSWPGEPLKLLRGPVQSVAIEYFDSSNELQTWSEEDYRLDNSGEISFIAPVANWPTVYNRSDAIKITFIAGENVKDIDSALKMAVAKLVVHMYENRGEIVVGSQVNKVPMASSFMLDPHVVYHASI